MHPGTGVRAGVIALAIAVPLAAAGPAAATTFCVPSFSAACPNNGSNIAETSLETAMQTNGDDTVADTIILDATTVSNADSYEILSGDNDDLEIVGAGPASTVITSTQSGNAFVMNLNGPRDVTMRDLTVRVPASMMDNVGGALQSEQDTFENVDLESRNVRSDGMISAIGGSTFSDGSVYGSNGGSIDVGFSGNGAETGVLEVRRTTILEPSWGINSDDPEVSVFARRVLITDPLAYGFRVSDGAFGVFENSIVSGADTGYPVIAESTDPGTVISTVRHVTISGAPPDPMDPAIKAQVHNMVGNGPINLVVRDTIVAGYPNPLWCEAPTSAAIGNASFSINFSYFDHSANVIGDCNLSNSNTLDSLNPAVGPPQFAGPNDFHLPAGSPAIDKGDTQVAGLTTEDYDGALRPVDGDGNGAARRDIGAFEYQPPVPPGGGGDPPPAGDPDPGPADPGPGGGDPTPLDTAAPGITRLKFKRGLSESDGGTIKATLTEAARLNVTFRPFRFGRRGTYKWPKLAYQAAAGKNKLKIGRRKLREGTFKVKAHATDAIGNRSLPAKTRVTVAD